MTTVRIATRESALALWQAEYVKAQLEHFHQDINVVLVPMTTKGDIWLDTPLAKIGGKGLFVKELDAFVSNTYANLSDLPQGAIVGTSSLRRQCQLKANRPDLDIRDLRGNVNTRLRKLDEGQYDAIILASAGLIRLKMSDRIAQHIEPEEMLPANGQGAVGIECRVNDDTIKALLAPLECNTTRIRVLTERAMNKTLEGGCQVPIASYSVISTDGKDIHLRGLVGAIDGSEIIESEITGPIEQGEVLGNTLAQELLSRGADKILKQVYADNQ